MYIQLDVYLSLFFIYSFLGWCLEVCWGLIILKKFVNRGFLMGPFCPIYGFAVSIITFITKNIENVFCVFFIVFAISAIVEYLTSFYMEKIFSARWWDYSNYKFNLNGRICLETLLPFALIGSLCVKFINPTLVYILSKVSQGKVYTAVFVFSVVMLSDFLLSSSLISNLKELSNSIRDNTEEVSQKVREKLKGNLNYYRRIFESFPLLEKSYNIRMMLAQEYKKAKSNIKETIREKAHK